MIVMNDNLLNKIKFQKYILMEGRKERRKKKRLFLIEEGQLINTEGIIEVRKVSMMQKTVGHSLRSFI